MHSINLIQPMFLCVILSFTSLHSSSAPYQTEPADTVKVAQNQPDQDPFVGVDPLETRATITVILVFVLAILTVLLTLKIRRADRIARIE